MTSSRRYDAQRRASKASRTWYKSKAWAARKRQQRAEHPLCELCLAEGVERLMSIVDHHPRHGEDYEQFFRGPVRSLCKPHHDGQVQSDEARGYDQSIGVDGWPVSPDAPFNRSK